MSTISIHVIHVQAATDTEVKVGIFVLRFLNIDAGNYIEIGGFEA